VEEWNNESLEEWVISDCGLTSSTALSARDYRDSPQRHRGHRGKRTNAMEGWKTGVPILHPSILPSFRSPVHSSPFLGLKPLTAGGPCPEAEGARGLSPGFQPWEPHLIEDRGRDEASFAPPTEPNGRISRIRLSSWWLLSKRSAIHAMSLL
jgi:hypothetical protein